MEKQKYIKRYKPYFVIKDPFTKQLNSVNKAKKEGFEVSFKTLHSLEEAVIRTEKYGKLLTDWFIQVIEPIKGKTFFETRELTKYLNYYFEEYDIRFAFNGTSPDEDNDKSGIYEMRSGDTTYEIRVCCDQYFKHNVSINSPYLIDTFKDLIIHELTHRGHSLLKKVNKLNITKENKSEIEFKNYLSQKHEIMAHANEAIEELRFEGFTNKDIIIMLKSYNFGRSGSTAIKHYMTTFNKKDPKDIKIIKQLYKYMYEYLYGDIKRDFN